MSKTYHHNAPKRSNSMRREGRYSGWEGEGDSQEVRRYNKDRSHRDTRRQGKRQGQLELMAFGG